MPSICCSPSGPALAEPAPSSGTVLDSCSRIRCWPCLPHSQPLLSLTGRLLALSNWSFLPPPLPKIVLRRCETRLLRKTCSSRCIAFMRFLGRVRLSRPPSDLLLRMFLVSWLLMLCNREGRPKPLRVVPRWLGYKTGKIHFAWELRQAAQAFPIVLTFLARRYCYR